MSSNYLLKVNELDFEAEKYAVRNFLENIYGLFSALIETGDIILTEDENIPTACISCCPITKNLSFYFNKGLWAKSNTYDRAFIICHEMLHVFLKHFTRLPEGVIMPLYNIATDVAINHMLCNLYSFEREALENWKKWCWTETVFPDQLYDNDLSSEVYYKLLIDGNDSFMMSANSESKEGDPKGGGAGILDEEDSSEEGDKPKEQQGSEKGRKKPKLIGGHGYNPNKGSQSEENKGNSSGEGETDPLEEAIKKFLDENFEEVSPEELIESISRGTMPGNLSATMKGIKAIPKRRWETLIREKTTKYITDTDNEQWARLSRRSFLLPNDLFIPSDQEIEDTDKEKVEVWFFLDTSGSCSGFATRFWKAALSLDPRYFIPKLLCFDTRVYEVNIKDKKLYGFGGTSFICMETYIQNYMKMTGSKYPKLIFVITDGYGDYIKPENPKVWNWFLTPQNTTYCIPKGSNIHLLSKFE